MIRIAVCDDERPVREFDPEVCLIFITTMYQCAIEGYKVRAFGFIRKPVSYAEFSHEIGDAVKRIEQNRFTGTVELCNGNPVTSKKDTEMHHLCRRKNDVQAQS